MSFTAEVIAAMPPGGSAEDLAVAERVLGSVMADPRLLDEPEHQALRPGDFYGRSHRALYGWLRGRGPEAERLAVAEARAALADLGHEVPLAWLCQIVDDSAGDWRWPATRVAALAAARRAQEAAVTLWRAAQEPVTSATPDSLAREVGAILGALSAPEGQVVETVAQIAPRWLSGLEASRERGSQAMSTGIAGLDRLLGGGVHTGDLVIPGARPSSGKTSLGRQIALAVASQGAGVLFVSLEVRREQVMADLVTGATGVPAQVYRSGQLTPQQWAQTVDGVDDLASSEAGERIYVTDRHRDLGRILACARSHARLNGVRLVIVDYLQLVRHDDHRIPRREQVGAVSRALKALALEHDLAVIALAQLNRSVDKDGSRPREPRMSDLKESGDIEQDADVVALINRPQGNRDQLAELIVDKNRNGPTGRVALTFDGPAMRFRDPEPAWKPRSA